MLYFRGAMRRSLGSILYDNYRVEGFRNKDYENKEDVDVFAHFCIHSDELMVRFSAVKSFNTNVVTFPSSYQRPQMTIEVHPSRLTDAIAIDLLTFYRDLSSPHAIAFALINGISIIKGKSILTFDRNELNGCIPYLSKHLFDDSEIPKTVSKASKGV